MKQNMDNIKLLINNNNKENIINIIHYIENKIINEIIPNNNNIIYEQCNNLIVKFKEEFKNINKNEILDIKYNDLFKNIETLIINNNTEISNIKNTNHIELNNLNNNITNSELRIQNIISEKNNDIKTSLINYISKSEERLQNNNNSLIKHITNNDEQIKNNIIEMKTNTEYQNKTLQKIDIHLDIYNNNSSKKGSMSENKIEDILHEMYKTAEIIKTTNKSNSGDFILIRNNISILFEIKNYKNNVTTEEINKFLKDINNKNMCGIMISINSGICNKNNFQIDINNNNICLYIHDMKYDPCKIKTAVDIIDNLYLRLNYNNLNNDIKISMDMLINLIKDSTKKQLQLIDDMIFDNRYIDL